MIHSVDVIAVIGDIHQEDVLLEHVLDFLQSFSPDVIVAVGDIADGPGDGAHCCELLAAREVEVVRGNHDRWLLKEAETWSKEDRDRSALLSFIEGLPPTRQYQTGHGQLLLCHGLGPDDMNRLLPDDYGYALESNDELQELLSSKTFRFVVNGHTHQRMVRDFGGVTVINAGTLLRGHAPCFALLNFKSRTVVFYDIDPETHQIKLASTHPLTTSISQQNSDT